MEEADKHGDSESIFRIVKVVSGLITASSSQTLSMDKNGDSILDQGKLDKT